MIRSSIALVVSIIAVHAAYIGYIRPEAAQILEMARAGGQSAPRDILVIIKDWEQEICFILMFWGMFLILDKVVRILKDQYLFTIDLVTQNQEEADSLSSALQTLEELPDKIKTAPLVHTLRASIRRYLMTNSVQDTSEAIESAVEALAMKQDAENAMIRYLIWAIPSIGFIGTVRGIGGALSQADQALGGDIAGMTESLGVAFNSTLVALLISIGLMFLLHQLQRLQDGLVVETQSYCETFLLNRIGSEIGH